MIIPNVEWDKKAKLEQLFNDLCKLSEMCNIDEHYGLKFSQVLQMATSKLVGCEAKLEVCRYKPSPYSSQQWFGLTRDGIKESFGWDAKEKKLRRMSGNFWKCYVGEKTFIPGLGKLLGNPEIQNPQGLQVAIDFAKDLKKLLGRKDTYGNFNDRDIKFEKKYELTHPVKMLEDLDLEYPTQKKHVVKDISISLTTGYGGVTIELGQQELEFSGGDDTARLDICRYIGVSEPEMYGELVRVMTTALEEGRVYLDNVAKDWKATLEKYGQFAMLIELEAKNVA